jgi:acetate kinase
MRVLVLNSGSSTLKFCLVDLHEREAGSKVAAAQYLCRGIVEHVGGEATLQMIPDTSPTRAVARSIPDHARAVQWVFEHLDKREVDSVGHRVVHGGELFRTPVLIRADVIAAIESLSELAPLHNPACLAGIRGARAVLGPDVPMVAVFDTAFHRTLPDYAATYAIPHELAARHRIRRYGFHGIAHASLVRGYAAFAGRRLEEVHVITLHLGNGCSAAAIRNGRCVDTSMGFTPLEGLVMGTRSGDLDPAVVNYLARREDVSAEQVERWLNERSGLLGLSGLSYDMRTLLKAAKERGDPLAAQAIEIFCYRVRKYLGAYLAVLGGAEAVLFGGGIGERAPEIRARICEGMNWCGLGLDPDRNAAAVGLEPGKAACISRGEAGLAAYVVAADEETEIAREAVRCLEASEP